ncbi:hypothetical protein LIER_09510 [Lithospermum erythrorhizon]|uniref:Protein kinase domain-containing protein n=1 Tax=Lithospermum erythrorhizon TaxID=34254 RepID=A0AAV3PFZ6_LITER
MVFATFSSSSSIPITLHFKQISSISRTTSPPTRKPQNPKKQKQTQIFRNFGNKNDGLRNIGELVNKDLSFIKKGIGKGISWANEAFRIPQIMKSVDDVIWLRHLENKQNGFDVKTPSWPQPSYPELSGMDMFMADLKALEVYGNYFYCLSKMWTKPLPETYNPEEVAMYFSLRPHLVTLRLLEVFTTFASAAIRLRISGAYSSADDDERQSELGMVLKETLLSLGPTFIKVGQSLSTRPDLIGSEISKALSELHDQIPPFPRMEAMKIIEEELGSPAGTIFSDISEEPVAAASFGQVYRGRTLDGSSVAVKVQRLNLYHVVVRDAYILRLGLGLFQKVAKRKSDLRLYADELGKGLVGELDYTLEAANASEFLEAHSSFPFMRVPKVFPHLTRKRILTMEWIVGESPNELILSTEESVDNHLTHTERHQTDGKRKLLDLVSKGVEATLIQLLETGLLHADPHPGNLRYTSSGQIGFLDFGLVCRMEKKHQLAMLAAIVHIVNGEWASLVQALSMMDVTRPGTNIRLVTMDLEDALGQVEVKGGISDVKFSLVLSKIWSVAIKYHFRMPPYFTLVLRSLASFEGLAVAADPTFKTFDSAYLYVVRKLLTDNSVAMRRILHSVVLNRRKEFQWQKLAVFLRVGATRKGLQGVKAATSLPPAEYSSFSVTGELDVANFFMRVLPSKDGAVLRRLLVTADGASLVRAVLTKEATFVRQQVCKIIADILYQWMRDGLAPSIPRVRGMSHLSNMDLGLPSAGTSSPIHDYKILLQDRRLRLIASKILDSARKDRVLIVRFVWTSLTMFIKSSALAFHRLLVSLSEAYLGHISFSPQQIMVGV